MQEQLQPRQTLERIDVSSLDVETPKSRPQSGSRNLPDGDPAVGGILAIAAIVIVAMSLRPGIVSVGPILPSIIDEFQLSHATASLLVSIPDVLMGLLALPTPWLARRFGRNPVLLTALVSLALSIFARAFSTAASELLMTTVGVGIGIAIAGALVAGFIKEYFPARAAFVMGIYATALSFGSSLSAAITGPIATNAESGWRVASGIWSIFGLFAIIAWLAVVMSERRNAVAERKQTAVMRLPIKNRKAWGIALYFACINFLFYSLLSWITSVYVEIGFSTTTAGFILATFLVVFMAANPIFGWLSKSLDRRAWLAGCGLFAMAGLVPLAVVPDLAPFLFIAVCAIGLGGAFTLAMTLPLDNTRSVEEANSWNAFVMMVAYIVAATGPLLVGRLRDLNGNFQIAMWLLVAVAALMCVLSPFLKPNIHHHSD